MQTSEMDYFEQKPNLDLKSFFEIKGLKMDAAGTPVTGVAPPPKGHAWVAPDDPVDTPVDDEE